LSLTGTTATASVHAIDDRQVLRTRPSVVRSKTESADDTLLERVGRTKGWRSPSGTFLRRRLGTYSRFGDREPFDP